MKIVCDNKKEKEVFITMLKMNFKLKESPEIPNYYFNTYMKVFILDTNDKEIILTLNII